MYADVSLNPIQSNRYWIRHRIRHRIQEEKRSTKGRTPTKRRSAFCMAI